MENISLENIKPDLVGGLYIAITSGGDVVVKGFGDSLTGPQVEALADKLTELSNKVRSLEPN